MDKRVQQAQGVIKSENPDRLELVRSMHIALLAINTTPWDGSSTPTTPTSKMFNLD